MKYEDLMKQERACPFCATKPEEIILENKSAYLTFALAPYHPDHLLVVPKIHREHILDITPAEMVDIDALQDEGWKILKKLGYTSVTFLVREGEASGRSVRHTHYHLIPEVRIGDLDHAGNERSILTPEEIARTVARAKSAIA